MRFARNVLMLSVFLAASVMAQVASEYKAAGGLWLAQIYPYCSQYVFCGYYDENSGCTYCDHLVWDPLSRRYRCPYQWSPDDGTDNMWERLTSGHCNTNQCQIDPHNDEEYPPPSTAPPCDGSNCAWATFPQPAHWRIWVCQDRSELVRGACAYGSEQPPAPSCPGHTCGGFCACQDPCPIAVSLQGKGFKFTQPIVPLKSSGPAPPDVSSLWSFPNADDGVAWLALDDSPADGVIDNFGELAGNGRPHPEGVDAESWNGYEWLKRVDLNGDGIIDANDPIYSRLVFWLDKNRNGRSDPGELVSLSSQGVLGIDLNYKESKRTDEIGNQFRYRARLILSATSQAEPWSYDVISVVTAKEAK